MQACIASAEKATTPRLINERVFKTFFKKRPAAIAVRRAISSTPAGNAENAPIPKSARSVEKKSGFCLSINTAAKIGNILNTSKTINGNVCQCRQVHRLPDKHSYKWIPWCINNADHSTDY